MKKLTALLLSLAVLMTAGIVVYADNGIDLTGTSVVANVVTVNGTITPARSAVVSLVLYKGAATSSRWIRRRFRSTERLRTS